jgi:hypothetical protein
VRRPRAAGLCDDEQTLARTATHDEIRHVCCRLARKLHPDVSQEPREYGAATGDLYLDITLPPASTEAERLAYRAMAQAFGHYQPRAAREV